MRRLDLSLDPATAPRDYYAGDPHLTAVLNALSTFFPDGERFFVESVRHFKDRIDDPVLQKEIAGFVGQEAMHTKEHEAFNAMLEAQGVPRAAKLGDGLARGLLNIGRRFFPKKDQLAVTVALEHYTAIIGEQLLAEPWHNEKLAEPVRGLWLWHALEESEHKTVAFDVYEAVDGSYVRRAWIMVPVTTLFLGASVIVYFAMLAEGGHLGNVRGLLRAVNYLWVRPGVFRRLLPGFFAYFRPGFHPTDHDSRALIAHWNQQLFGADGSMRVQLKQVRVPNAPAAAAA